MSAKDIVIIGAGPAGIATAIQLKRYYFEPILLEQFEPGGLLKNANLVENYPGFPEGISGLKLAELFKQHLITTGINICNERVLNLDYINEEFKIETNRKRLSAKMVVVASGTKPKELLRPVIFDDMKDQIFFDIYPINNIKDKKIIIIGAGDAAFDYALNLCAANEVMILNRSEKVKCLPLLWQRSQQIKNISYLENVKVEQFYKVNKQMYLSCIHSDCKIESQICADYVLIAIGRKPNLDFLSQELKNKLSDLQKLKKLYLVGDVKNDIFRQVGISVGDGIKTAMEIYKLFRSEKREN